MRTYKEILSEVIREHGYSLSWMEKFSNCANVNRFGEIAAEIFANECVKADRARIGKSLDADSLNYDGKVTRYEEYLTSESYPLPFP